MKTTEQRIVGIIDLLTFTSYAHNRRLSPHIMPEQWAMVYGDTSAMERRFQEEGR